VVDNPFRTSLRRNPDDRRPLAERINAQLMERIEEAVELAGLQLMVELRRAEGRPAPESASAADREEFQVRTREVLEGIAQAFHAQLGSQERTALAGAEAAGGDRRRGRLAGQVYLAKTLPDYWQRFELHRTAYSESRLSRVRRPRSWFRRLVGGPSAT
jgi:hypothetical protein